MGQYHYLLNLTKKQVVHPHRIGNGLKLHEQVGWAYSTSTALVMLLAGSNGRGGGDFQSSHPLVGSWAGDRIAFLGDYAEKGDIHGCKDAIAVKQCAQAACYPPKPSNGGDHQDDGGWKDISPLVREMMASEFDIEYQGDEGWLEIKERKPQTTEQ